MVATDDREVSAAVPLRVEINDHGRWELALISDDGEPMTFEARTGRLKCDRINLSMESPDRPDDGT